MADINTDVFDVEGFLKGLKENNEELYKILESKNFALNAKKKFISDVAEYSIHLARSAEIISKNDDRTTIEEKDLADAELLLKKKEVEKLSISSKFVLVIAGIIFSACVKFFFLEFVKFIENQPDFEIFTLTSGIYLSAMIVSGIFTFLKLFYD